MLSREMKVTTGILNKIKIKVNISKKILKKTLKIKKKTIKSKSK